MKGPDISKADMNAKRKILGTRISTQLLIINALICIVFFLIVFMVFISFHNIQGMLRGVIIDDMNEVTANALTERELSTILADTNLLLNTFFENQAHLNNEGSRLLTYTLVLISNNKGHDLEQPLQLFAKRLGLLLQQCSVVNTSLDRLRTVDRNITALIERLEDIIAEKIIDTAFRGEDKSILEQLSVLVSGYQQSFFKIGKLHAETWPEKYYTPINTENDPLIVAVDELILRFRTLKASDPEVAQFGGKLITDFQAYRGFLLNLNKDMVALKARWNAIEDAKRRSVAVMDKLDRNVTKATRAVDLKVSHRFWVTGMALLIISVSLVVALIVLTAVFFKRIIKKPMDDIQEGIKAFRSGNLDSRISLNRRDEWHLVEDALNTMAADLSTSYTALQKAHGELETKVSERTAELSDAKENALDSQRTAEAANQSKSEFLARMSHEIRTPLNAVTGLTSIVLKSQLTAEQRDYLNKVKIASNNLLEVINDILDFSKVEAGRLELTLAPFDLDQVMEQLADIFLNRVAKKDVELVFAAAPHVPRQLTGDAGRLTQVLTNLVENAVKFTSKGEIVVDVTIDDDSESGEQVIGDREIFGSRKDNDSRARKDQQNGQTALRFSVSDTGDGIAGDMLPSLFEPFTQADSYLTRKHEGTGLGLAICRRLVELMNGRIWAESTPGRGSTFSFTVMMEAHKEKKSQVSQPEELFGLKVLVVDDSAAARQVMVHQLESFTFNVASVDSGEKAIEALGQANEDEPYQLLLLDWKMPGMDGIETAKRIRKEFDRDRLPIIVMATAYGRKLVQAHMDTETVDAMLLKPVKPSQLFNAIMNIFKPTVGVTPSRPPDVAVLSAQRLPGRRILVVEDSELNRDVAVALLEEAGLVVEIADNGRTAVDMLSNSPKGYYDAILMDIQMPVMDGYEATRRIREWESRIQDESTEPSAISQQLSTRSEHLPIIALTAHALKGEKEKCLAADMDDYLSKPLDERELFRVLIKWVASRPIEDDGAISQQSSETSDNDQGIFDVQGALKRLGGRKLLYNKVLGKFKTEFAKAHAVISRQLADSSMEEALRLAHTVKGTAAAIGAVNLNLVAADLETAIRDNDPEIDGLLSVFENELEKTLQSISKMLETDSHGGYQAE